MTTKNKNLRIKLSDAGSSYYGAKFRSRWNTPKALYSSMSFGPEFVGAPFRRIPDSECSNVFVIRYPDLLVVDIVVNSLPLNMTERLAAIRGAIQLEPSQQALISFIVAHSSRLLPRTDARPLLLPESQLKAVLNRVLDRFSPPNPIEDAAPHMNSDLPSSANSAPTSAGAPACVPMIRTRVRDCEPLPLTGKQIDRAAQLVLGRFSAGKTSYVDAMVRSEAAPTTPTPTEVERPPLKVVPSHATKNRSDPLVGRYVLVAFNTFDGCKFEDAIVINERLVQDEVFRSIQIEAYELTVRENELGREMFTRDIPNVSEKVLKNLDENGLIRIGARVGPGDILVGKISPKSPSELTPEEKLLSAIFGRAGDDVKNESLEVPAGVEGVVIGASRLRGRMPISADLPRGDELSSSVLEIVHVYLATKRTLSVGDEIDAPHGNKAGMARIVPEEEMPFIADGTAVDVLLNPLGVGGKLGTSGQRFGEMEVWALEPDRTASLLRELLTVNRDDDVEDRTKIYESMVKGTNKLEEGMPVAFDVLCSDLKGLGLNVSLDKQRSEGVGRR